MADKLANLQGNSALLLQYIFGMNCDIRQESQLCDPKHLLYSAGQYVVKLNMEDNTQDFTQGYQFVSQITAMCLSTSRNIVAVAKRGDKPIIHIHDTSMLRKNNHMTTGGLPESINSEVREYSFLNFCLEDDRLLSLSTEVQPIVILWELGSTQIGRLAHYRVASESPFFETMFSPMNNNVISMVGRDDFKLLRYQEGDMRVAVTAVSYKNMKPKDIVCHTWLHKPNIEAALVCHDKNIFFVNEKGVCTGVFEGSKVLVSPTCVEKMDGGFILGDRLNVHIFRQNTVSQEFEIVKTINLLASSGDITSQYGDDLKENFIKTLHIDFLKQEKVVAVTDKRNIYSAFINNDPDEQLLSKRGNFQLVTDPVHSSRITAMDLCKRKPYVVTSSQDKTVKVWDYERRQLVFLYSFAEEVNAVAFHPSGLHIAVSFSDKVQFLNLYLGRGDQPRREWKEITVKNCQCLRFSNGGGFLALSSGGTLQTILIYPFYSNTNAPLWQLQGHSGIVTGLVWDKHDHFLYSCCSSGLIFRWRMRDGNRKDFFSVQTPYINDMALSPDNSTFYYVVDDKQSLRENSNQESAADESVPYGTVAITNSNKMLFTGVKDKSRNAGSIMHYRTPPQTFSELFHAHDYRGVEKIVITHDDNTLLSCGVDGTLIMFSIAIDKEKHGGMHNNEFKTADNNILVTRQEIDELSIQKESVISLVGEEKNSNASNLDMGGRIDENIKNLQEEISKEDEGNSKKYKEESDEKNQLETRLKTELAETKANLKKQLKQLEVWMTMRLTEKQENLKELTQNKKEESHGSNLKFMEVQAKHEQLMQRKKFIFETELQKEREAKQQLLNEIEETKQEHAKMLELVEQEVGKEQEDLQAKFTEEVENLKKQQIKLKNNISSHQKKEKKHADAIQALIEEHEEKKRQYLQLRLSVDELKKETSALENRLREKNNKITSKEKTIYDLKRRTQELEKFKYVLDFKIKELKCDIVPREKEIGRLKEKIISMDTRLKEYNANNNLLSKVVESLEDEQKNLKERIKTQKLTLKNQKSQIRSFKNSLYDAVQHILDYKGLKERLLRLNNGKVRKPEMAQDIFEEYKSQLIFLEKSVNEFRQDLDRDSEMHKQDGMRIMMDNVNLIDDINNLHDEINKTKKTENPHSKIKRIMQNIAKEGKDFEQYKDYTEGNILEKVSELKKLQRKIEHLQSNMNAIEEAHKLPETTLEDL